MRATRSTGEALASSAIPALLALRRRREAAGEPSPHRAPRWSGSGLARPLLSILMGGLVTATLALVAAPASAHAATSAVGAGDGLVIGQEAQVVNTPFLHLRCSPSISCNIITDMPEGAIVTVNGGPTSADGYEWYQVTYQGQIGYAVGDYLAPVESPPICSSPCSLVVGEYAVVISPILHLRCGPSISCSVITVLHRGDVVKVLEGPTSADGYEWYQVSFQNLTGYVAGNYLRHTSGPCASSCPLEIGAHAMVISENLNLRNSPGLSCPILLRLSQGAIVVIESSPTRVDGYDWYKVSYQGTEGYVAGEYLVVVNGNGGQPCATSCGPVVGHDAIVTGTPYLHLRSGAGLTCDIMMTMYEGDRVHVTGGPTSVDGYDWYHVTYQGTDGYAAGAYLVRAD